MVFAIGDESGAEVEVRWPCGAIQKVRVEAGGTAIVRERGCRLLDR